MYRYQPISVQAGRYLILPVGPDMGGAYTAWNAWGGQVSGCNDMGVCSRGYLNSYSLGYIDSIGFVQEIATIGGRVDTGTAVAYATEQLAFLNAKSFELTLDASTRIYFYVRDLEGGYSDNKVSTKAALHALRGSGDLP